MWSLGVIVYVLLTLARAKWNGTCGGLLELAKASALTLKLAFQRFLECSLLIPAPTKWRESYSSLEASFRDENMIVVFLPTRKPPLKLASDRRLLSWTSKDRRDALSRPGVHRVTNKILGGAIHFLFSMVYDGDICIVDGVDYSTYI